MKITQTAAAANYAAIIAVAAQGFLAISEDTVDAVAALLEKSCYINGTRVTVYNWAEYPSYVPAVDAANLHDEFQQQLRHLFAAEGATALALFDVAVNLDLEMTLCGAENADGIPSYMKVVPRREREYIIAG